MTKRFDIDGAPSQEILEDLAAMIRRGGVVILPTDTIYGFHASALDEAAIQRIFEIKERSGNKAFPVLCSSIEQLKSTGGIMGAEVEEFLAATWPAPLTAVVELRAPIAASAGNTTLAVRVPALDWLRNLTQLAGPIASTSVNKSGSEPLYSTKKIGPDLESAVQAIVNVGDLPGQASTVVDFTVEPPTVIRTGAFPFTQNLWKSVRKTL